MSAHHFAADHALGVLHRNAALAAFHVHDEADHNDHQDDQQDHQTGVNAPQASVFDFVEQIGDAARQADHDAGEDQQRHAVARCRVP